MFIELNRKDNQELVVVNADHIATFNTDEDGNGTMLVFNSGVIRVVTQTYARVKSLIGVPSSVEVA